MSRKFKSLKKQRYKVNNPRKGLLDTKLSIKVKSSLNSKKIKEFYKNSKSSLSKNRISTSGKLPSNVSPINGLKLYRDYQSHLKLIDDSGISAKFNRTIMPDSTLNTFINKVTDRRNDDDPTLRTIDAIPFFKLFKMYENFKNFGMDDLIGKFPKDKYFHLFKTEFPPMKNIINTYRIPPRNDIEKYRVAILEPSDSKKSINTYVYFKFEKSSFSGSSRGMSPLQIKILWIYSKIPNDAKEIYLLMIHFYYIMVNNELSDLFAGDEDQKPSFITFEPEFYKQFKDSDMFKHIRDVFGHSMTDISIGGRGVEQFIIPLNLHYILKDLYWGKDLNIPPPGGNANNQTVSQDLETLLDYLGIDRDQTDFSIFLIKPNRQFYKYNHTVPLYKKVIKILNSMYLDENGLFKDYLILIVNKIQPDNVLEEYFLEGFLTFRIIHPKVARLKCLHIFENVNPYNSDFKSVFKRSDFRNLILVFLVILNNMNINICITDFINDNNILLKISILIRNFITSPITREGYFVGSLHHHNTGFDIKFYESQRTNFSSEYNYQFFFIKKLKDKNNYTDLITKMIGHINLKGRLRKFQNNNLKGQLRKLQNSISNEWFHGAIEQKIPIEKYNEMNKDFKLDEINIISMKKGLKLFLNVKKYGGITYPFRYNIYLPDFYPRFESYEAYLNMEKEKSGIMQE